MFSVNQRVVCVNADMHPAVWEFVKPLTKDKQYTIREVKPGEDRDGKPQVVVYLHEIHNRADHTGEECGYNGERFAPLEEDDEEAGEWVPDKIYQAQYAHASGYHD